MPFFGGNALSNSMDLAFPISCDRAVSHTCGSFQQGVSSFSNFHYFLTVNFSHSAQMPSVSLTEGWKKGDMRSHSNQEITSSRWWVRDAVSELQFLTVLPEEEKINKNKRLYGKYGNNIMAVLISAVKLDHLFNPEKPIKEAHSVWCNLLFWRSSMAFCTWPRKFSCCKSKKAFNNSR